MKVSEAVAKRRSTRAFRPDPVPLDTIRAILEQAARAPSGSNLQPWHVYVVAGAKRDALVARVKAQLADRPHGETPDHVIHPPDMPEPYHARYMRASGLIYGAIGIQREDKTARQAHLARNWAFFGAPVGLIFTIDRRMERSQWADVGMYIQTVMLLAAECGLDSCAQEAWALWPQTLRAMLPIPAEELVYTGMAIGHGDTDAPVNNFRSERAPLAEFATFLVD